MTQIAVKLKDSENKNLVGFIEVTLDYVLLNQVTDTSFLPVTSRFPLVNGQATLELEPSESSKISYYFQIFQTTTVPGEILQVGTPPVPVQQPDVTVNLPLWSFRAKVPESLVPIGLTDLMEQTGISHDNQDSSIFNVVRRLYLNDNFWDLLQNQLFPLKGLWSATSFYRRGDVVDWQGCSFVYYNTLATAGNEPNPNANTLFWNLLASKGSAGAGTSGNDSPYSSIGWNNQTDAPSRNAVRDAIEGLVTQTEVDQKLDRTSGLMLGAPRLDVNPPINEDSSRLVSSSWVQDNLDIIRKALVPIGSIQHYAGTSAPNNWMLCDGRVVDRTTYSELFAVLGTTYNMGGETASQFRLPDCRGRFLSAPNSLSPLMGASGRNSYSLSSSGGAEAMTISATNLPAHQHTIQSFVINNPGTAFTFNDGAGDFLAATDNAAQGTNGLALAIRFATQADINGAQATNAPLPIMPPSIALNVIIYSGV